MRCIVLHSELHHNIVLRQTFPYGFGFAEQYKSRIIQLAVFEQVQIRQDLFIGTVAEQRIFLFPGILGFHFHYGFLIQILNGKSFAYLRREIRFLFGQHIEYLGIGHFTQALSGTHKGHTLKTQQPTYRA